LLGNHQKLSVIVENYEKTLEETLDKHVPLKRRTITIRPSAPWYHQDIGDAKRQKLESRWHVSRLCIDRQMHVEQCRIVNKMPRDAKASYYSSIISENASDPKNLAQWTSCYIVRLRGVFLVRPRRLNS
jgi:hypothetical protein